MFYTSFPNSQIIAFDLSEKMIEFARETYSNSNLIFKSGDICADWDQLSEKLDIKAGTIDIVISTYCLHWVSDTPKAMKNIYQMLKPGMAVKI